MTNILRFVQFLALGTWLGSIIYFSFAVAPALFSALSSRDQAGAGVGIALRTLPPPPRGPPPPPKGPRAPGPARRDRDAPSHSSLATLSHPPHGPAPHPNGFPPRPPPPTHNRPRALHS